MNGDKSSGHNHVFERLVPRDAEDGDSDKILGMIAYARYKEAKREWAQSIWDEHKRKPSDEEQREYARTWTDSRLEGAKIEALNALLKFARIVEDEITPAIEHNATRNKFWREVGAAMVGGFFYSVLLILFAAALRYVGVDLLHALENLAKAASENIDHLQQSSHPPPN